MLGDPPQEKQRQAGCRECAESRGLCRVRHSALRQQANASLSGLGFPIGQVWGGAGPLWASGTQVPALSTHIALLSDPVTHTPPPPAQEPPAHEDLPPHRPMRPPRPGQPSLPVCTSARDPVLPCPLLTIPWGGCTAGTLHGPPSPCKCAPGPHGQPSVTTALPTSQGTFSRPATHWHPRLGCRLCG